MRTKNIFVFKTNVQNAEQADKLKVLTETNEIIDWNTDLEDCDNILRVVGSGISSDQIIQIMNKLGFSCEELAMKKCL